MENEQVRDRPISVRQLIQEIIDQDDFYSEDDGSESAINMMVLL